MRSQLKIRILAFNGNVMVNSASADNIHERKKSENKPKSTKASVSRAEKGMTS